MFHAGRNNRNMRKGKGRALKNKKRVVRTARKEVYINEPGHMVKGKA